MPTTIWNHTHIHQPNPLATPLTTQTQPEFALIIPFLISFRTLKPLMTSLIQISILVLTYLIILASILPLQVLLVLTFPLLDTLPPHRYLPFFSIVWYLPFFSTNICIHSVKSLRKSTKNISCKSVKSYLCNHSFVLIHGFHPPPWLILVILSAWAWVDTCHP
jgi:hypothetical protein